MGLRITGGDEIVQSDCRYGDDLACSRYRLVAVCFHTAMRRDHSTAPKRNSLTTGRRPYGTMNHSKAILSQLISPDVFSESADILGITIKRDNATQFAYEPCGAECKASQVGSNIIDNHPRLNSADNCILHVRFVSALPIPCFTRD